MPDDIYRGEHSGWYCQNEETFVPENQVRDGKDESGHAVEWTTENNLFFKLSRYTQPLLDWYEAHPDAVQPEGKRNEAAPYIRAKFEYFSGNYEEAIRSIVSDVEKWNGAGSMNSTSEAK